MGVQPEELSYTSEHEWLHHLEDGSFRVGITDYAQDALGDVVYVDLPETGRRFARGEVMGEVESTKSVSEIYAPVDGVIVSRNESLIDDPCVINSDPLGEGWIVVLKPENSAEVSHLLSHAEYQKISGNKSN